MTLRGTTGIEPVTSRTRSANHTTRPCSPGDEPRTGLLLERRGEELEELRTDCGYIGSEGISRKFGGSSGRQRRRRSRRASRAALVGMGFPEDGVAFALMERDDTEGAWQWLLARPEWP